MGYDELSSSITIHGATLKFSKSDLCILFPFVHTENIINLSMVEEYRIWIF